MIALAVFVGGIIVGFIGIVSMWRQPPLPPRLQDRPELTGKPGRKKQSDV